MTGVDATVGELVTDPHSAPDATASIRGAALLLAATGTFEIATALWNWRVGDPLLFGPGFVAPLAAWGLLRRRRAWWVIALAVVWTTALAIVGFGISAALGDPLGDLNLFGHRFTEPRTICALLAPFLAVALTTHVLLTRPEMQRDFRPHTSEPWGSGTSLVLAGFAVGVSQAVAGVIAAWLADVPAHELQDTASLLANGRFLAYAATISAPLSLLLVAASVWLRNGPRLAEYLALRPVPWRTLLRALLVTAALMLVEQGVNAWLDRPVPPFVANAYRSGADLAVLWISFVLLAPISEEVAFRGFLFAGFGDAPAKAVLVTAVTFTSLHLGQYGPWELAFLFAFGVLLGVARARTASLYPPIAMHMCMNLTALLATAAVLH
jgi:membrane protease YdiL (CAAX protease family)